MIKNGKKCKIHYTLTVYGEIVDSSENKEPLEYVHGSGQIITGLECALKGLKVGEMKQIMVGPDDAYGPINPQAILEVPREKLGHIEIEIGSVLKAEDPEGKTIQGMIKEIHDSSVTVDFNHPLAGKELNFEVKVIEIN